MKVLHVVPSYIPAYHYGGPVKVTHELCKALVDRGLETTVFTTNSGLEKKPNVPLNEQQNLEGVNVTYYPVGLVRRYCYSRDLAESIKTQIAKFDIVHIHSVFLYPTYITAYWCRRKNIPYIINPFGALDPDMIKLKSTLIKKIYIKMVEQHNIKKAAAVHLASSYEKKRFLSLGFNTPVAIVPRGLNVKNYTPCKSTIDLRKQYPQLKRKKIILFLGRIHFKKGLDLLALTFKKAVDKNKDIALVIAGSGEEGYVGKVKALFREKGIMEYTLFTGMLLGSEKLSAIYGSNLFVLPSYGENFGVAALEAMVCGVPVVVTDRVGLYPDIEEYKAGIVTDCDSDKIAGAISKLLDNEDMRKSMGENGKRLVQDRFALDIVTDKMIAVYKEITQR